MAATVAEIVEMLRNANEREFAALERSLVADQRKGVRKAVEVARKRVAAERAEAERLESLYAFERSLVSEGADGCIVGLDEVGRGPVAGPLAVGAVVLPPDRRIEGLNDSKQVKPEMRREVAERGVAPALVLVDGNPLHIHELERNVVKGDAKCASIAAASIVAKVERDELMERLAPLYPHYGFDENKGYASPQHIDAIRTYGLCEIHRASFCRSFMQETLF